MGQVPTGSIAFRKKTRSRKAGWWARITLQDGSRPWFELKASTEQEAQIEAVMLSQTLRAQSPTSKNDLESKVELMCSKLDRLIAHVSELETLVSELANVPFEGLRTAGQILEIVRRLDSGVVGRLPGGTNANFQNRVGPKSELLCTVLELATKVGIVPSQRGIAAAVGCDQAIVARWLSGRSLPSRRNFEKFADALKVTVDYLEQLTARGN